MPNDTELTPETLMRKWPRHASDCPRYQRGLLNTQPPDCTCEAKTFSDTWAADRAALAEARALAGEAKAYLALINGTVIAIPRNFLERIAALAASGEEKPS